MIAKCVIVFLFGLAAGCLANKFVVRFSVCGQGCCENSGKTTIQRYHVVEVLTAVVVTTLFIRFDATIYFLLFAFLFTVLITIFFIDIRYRIIPNKLVIAAIIVGLPLVILNIFRPIYEIFGYEKWWAPIVGFFSGSGLLLLVAVLGGIILKTDDAMGMGDVKLMAPIGLFLGWKLSLISLIISIVIAGASGILLIIMKLKRSKDTIPFGPFIIIGAYVTIMWGWDIIKMYVGNY